MHTVMSYEMNKIDNSNIFEIVVIMIYIKTIIFFKNLIAYKI